MSPTDVEKSGVETRSTRPPTPPGSPRRTGRSKISSATSSRPSRRAVPPVRTMPELIGLGGGCRRADGDVVGEVVAADGDRRGVPEAAAVVDGHLGRPGADVDLADAELALVLGQDGLGRGDLVEDDLLDADAGPLDAAAGVLERGQGGRDDGDEDLEP